MTKKITYNVGGYVEDDEWFILFDEEESLGHGDIPCKHASAPITKVRGVPPYTYKVTTVTVPRVVVALNEGGCNSTAVCLDCILEAAQELAKEKFDNESH